MTPVPLTPALLRDWPLPQPSGSKNSRGSVLVIGGAARTPGAVLLAGLAALRVGAGRLSLAVAEQVAGPLAVAVPEAGVIGLPQTPRGSVAGAGDELADELARADAVLVGPGLDELAGARALLRAVADESRAPLLLDAFALGALADDDALSAALAGRSVLTPNATEARLLVGGAPDEDPLRRARRVARRYGAVVAASGFVVADDGRVWQSASGRRGLGTSGSGDVLAGAVAGLLATGAPRDQAACWGTALHAAAGDALAIRVGPVGSLARELVDELPRVLQQLGAD